MHAHGCVILVACLPNQFLGTAIDVGRMNGQGGQLFKGHF